MGGSGGNGASSGWNGSAGRIRIDSPESDWVFTANPAPQVGLAMAAREMRILDNKSYAPVVTGQGLYDIRISVNGQGYSFDATNISDRITLDAVELKLGLNELCVYQDGVDVDKIAMNCIELAYLP